MTINLTPAAKKLLREIAKHGDAGVVFYYVTPGQRWRMDGTDYIVSRRTFLQLSDEYVAFIDVGNGNDDPVRITAAGRAWLAAA
jgi:hypothetical protein